MKKDFTSNYQR